METGRFTPGTEWVPGSIWISVTHAEIVINSAVTT